MEADEDPMARIANVLAELVALLREGRDQDDARMQAATAPLMGSFGGAVDVRSTFECSACHERAETRAMRLPDGWVSRPRPMGVPRAKGRSLQLRTRLDAGDGPSPFLFACSNACRDRLDVEYPAHQWIGEERGELLVGPS